MLQSIAPITREISNPMEVLGDSPLLMMISGNIHFLPGFGSQGSPHIDIMRLTLACDRPGKP